MRGGSARSLWSRQLPFIKHKRKKSKKEGKKKAIGTSMIVSEEITFKIDCQLLRRKISLKMIKSF